MLLLACLAGAPQALAGDDPDDDISSGLDEADDEAEEEAEKLLEDLLESRFGDDADLDDLEDELEDWLEQQLERQGSSDDLEDRLEQELEKRLQGLGDDDDADERAQRLDEELHQLWQLEDDLDDSILPPLPDQVIALLSAAEVATARAQGVLILAEQSLPELEAVLVTFGSQAPLPYATEPNHLYQLDEAAAVVTAATPLQQAGLMGIQQPGQAQQRIGLMDSAIHTGHPCLVDVPVSQQIFHAEAAAAAPAHGTAMASILGGQPGCGADGLLQQPQLFNAVVFAGSGQGLVVASAAQLVAGLDWLLQQQVGIINMSLSGPPNRVLEVALQKAAARGVTLVASAGNEGPAAFPRYPAAYPQVIAVTAVDADGQVYARAAQGGHIDVAAPGVNVQVAAETGVRPLSGTSVAAAMVSAVLAQQPAVTRAALAQQTLDLGAAGRDPVFGFGLLQPGAKKISGRGE